MQVVQYLGSLYLLCRHVAHDMGNRALDPKARTQNPLRGIHTVPSTHTYLAHLSHPVADAPTASVTHIDVSLPAGITIASHTVLCMFRKRYFWLKSMQDAIHCPIMSLDLRAVYVSLKIPRILLFEFETALQLDLQHRRLVESESTGLLESEANGQGQ